MSFQFATGKKEAAGGQPSPWMGQNIPGGARFESGYFRI
jgi:hypothetical protein